jgi:hypothetical protein
MTSGGETHRLVEAYPIPSPAQLLFQTAFGKPESPATHRDGTPES